MPSKESKRKKKEEEDASDTPQIPQGEHVNLDYWHGLLPNEDTAAVLKNDGEFLLRAIEHDGQYNILLSVRSGTSQSVAVKVLTEMSVEASNSLWKEARVMMLYDHPNIVKMYGVANDITPYYLVMELVDGGALDRYLEKKGSKLSVKARVNILIEAATGLEYLHTKGCIHRDIACRNLLIAKVVKVADFGMTRRTSKYKVDPNKPMNLRWLAPEVYETAIVNKSTDVYAFGVTMYEAFTVPYAIPYADWKPEKVYDKVVVKGYRLHAPPKMPRMIADLMKECLGEPDQRPTFKTVLVCLRHFIKEGDKGNGLGIF